MKAVLKQAGVSQRVLADAVGVSTATISLIVNHQQYPKTPAKAVLVGKMQDFLRGKVSDADLKRVFEVESARSNAPIPNDAGKTKEEVMIQRNKKLSKAALDFFGMKRDPFNDELHSVEDVYLGSNLWTAREAMYQTAVGGGLTAIVGEVGAGKTTLRLELEDWVVRENKPVIIIQPSVRDMEENDKKGKTLKSASITEAIIRAVAPHEVLKQSSEARSAQLKKVLVESAKNRNKHVLIIEEAHCLPTATLKHLKRFRELTNGFEQLLGIILIGQPELKTVKLTENSAEVREVVGRCQVVELEPMDKNVEEYVKFKFDRAGKDVAKVIDRSGMDAIRDKLTIPAGRGKSISLLYPLSVGNLIVACMEQAAEIGVPMVNADVVKEAAK
jgi:type II secretory pathway predicted ATPase ExeA